VRNVAYSLHKEHAKKYILRLLKLGYSFEVAPRVRFVEVTVNQEAEPPKEGWLADTSELPVYD
jgi:hypothetical protein